MTRASAPDDEAGRAIQRAARALGDPTRYRIFRHLVDEIDVVIGRCPFAAVAVIEADTVCSLHLGMAKSLADRSDLRVEDLVRHDPHRAGCRLRLLPADAP